MDNFTGIKQYYSKEKKRYFLIDWETRQYNSDNRKYNSSDTKMKLNCKLESTATKQGLIDYLRAYNFAYLPNSPIQQIKVVGYEI